MGFDYVLLISVRVFAALAIASNVLFTIYMVSPRPVLRAVLDTYDVRASLASMAASCWTSLSDNYTDIALPAISALSAVVIQLGRTVLGVVSSPLLQLANRLAASAEPYVSPTMAHIYALGSGIVTGLRRIASDYPGTRLVDYFRIFAGFRADTSSATFSVSLLFGMLSFFFICFILYSLWILLSLEAPLNNNDLCLITTLNAQVTRTIRKIETLSKHLQALAPHAFALPCILIASWPAQVLRGSCYQTYSRRSMYLQNTLEDLRCDHDSFAHVDRHLNRLTLIYTARFVSISLAVFVGFVLVVYGVAGLYTIWATYLTRKKLASSKDSVSIPASTALVTRPPRTAHLSSILASTICSDLPDDYYFLQDFVDQYEPGVQLGAGSFGVVLQARRRVDGREVAVKFVKKGSHSDYWEEHPIYGRVPREVNIMDLVQHENIISLLDVFSDDRYAYIVQELHGSLWFPMGEQGKAAFPNGGRSLAAYICANGATPLEDARYIFYQLVDAVHSLHSIGITHCDIKPANILIDSNLKVKLIDFGSAIRRPSPEGGSWHGDPPKYYTDCRYFGGTKAYSPPELFRSQRDGSPFEVPPADIWALGVILCRLLTGIRPFRTQYGLTNGLLEYDTMDSSQWEALLPMWGVVDSCLDRVPQWRPTTNFLRRRNEHDWSWRMILEKTQYRAFDMYIEL